MGQEGQWPGLCLMLSAGQQALSKLIPFTVNTKQPTLGTTIMHPPIRIPPYLLTCTASLAIAYVCCTSFYAASNSPCSRTSHTPSASSNLANHRRSGSSFFIASQARIKSSAGGASKLCRRGALALDGSGKLTLQKCTMGRETSPEFS